MPAATWLLALTCVVAIAGGQILFKRVGLAVQAAGTWLDWRVATLGAVAIGLYGAATLLWIHVLRTADLGRVYPLMALSFVLVPLAGWHFFAERLTVQHAVGMALIVLGVVVIGRAG